MAEENRRCAAELHPQMERHQVSAEYLASPELVAALEAARAVAERMHLIANDGIEGRASRAH